MSEQAITYEHILSAHKRIAPYIHLTPVLTSETLSSFTKYEPISTDSTNSTSDENESNRNSMNKKELFFKAECLQKTGSFKARGATNAVLLAKETGKYTGVSTHSSGNHAQALAGAARTQGLQAHIVMPHNCPQVKRDAVIGYDAKVYLCEPTLKAREEMSSQITQDTGSIFIHPSENVNVICGQGTIGLEFMQQVPDLDAILVPVGGGGLISGISTAVKAIKSSIIVIGESRALKPCIDIINVMPLIGVEPSVADDAQRSKRNNTLIKHESTPDTVADGLRTSLGPNTWPVVRDVVDDILTASEADIVKALHLVWQRMKILIEPSAAVGVAVAIGEEFNTTYPQLKKVGIVLCGGNVDVLQVAELFKQYAV